MKKIAFNLTILSVLAILFAICFSSSCTKYDNTKVAEVRINKTELTLIERDFETLVATVTPATALNRKVTWNSDDPNVAKVDETGRVTAVKAGKANIIVITEDGNKTASCKVTVEAIAVTGISFNKKDLTLVKGGSETLTVKVIPKNASNKNITWSSDNPEIVEVNETGKITAIKAGETNITATSEDRNRSVSCSVTVVEGETININGVSLSMVYVQGGTFWMGAQADDPAGQNYDPDAFSWDAPVHQVTLTQNYYIGQYEVTQALWEAVTGITIEQQRNLKNPAFPLYGAGDNYPMYYVSWNEIVNDFLPKLNQITGKTFALPTEAQWEFAARGGVKSNGYKYSGSDNVYDVAWYNVNSINKGNRPVGTKSPNELGIYDMSGNVFEWCSDWYEKNYPAEPQTDPQGPESGSRRVLRSGNWSSDGRLCRVSGRYSNYPSSPGYIIGFRLALLP